MTWTQDNFRLTCSSSSFLLSSSTSSPPSPTCCPSTVALSPSYLCGRPVLQASGGDLTLLHVPAAKGLGIGTCVRTTDNESLVSESLSKVKIKNRVGGLTSSPPSGSPSRLVVALRPSSAPLSNGCMPSVGRAPLCSLPSKPNAHRPATTFGSTAIRSPSASTTMRLPLHGQRQVHLREPCSRLHSTVSRGHQQRVGDRGKGNISGHDQQRQRQATQN
jgi:hypothetical protein